MTVHPRPTAAQRREHRAAQIRHLVVSAIGVFGAASTIALSGIPWAALSAFTITLALGLVIAEPDLPGRNRAWLAPPMPGLLDLVEVIAPTRNTGGNLHDVAPAEPQPETGDEPLEQQPETDTTDDELLAVARRDVVIGRHCREGREAATVFLHAVTPASELVSTASDNGGNGGN
jgi:hypothetical protein